MIPCVFTKGSSNERGANAERTIYKVLQNLNECGKNKYFSDLKISGFVFHGQKYNSEIGVLSTSYPESFPSHPRPTNLKRNHPEHEVDFLFVTRYGLLVMECKAVGSRNQATSKYEQARGQLLKRIPTLKNLLKSLGIDVTKIPIMDIVAFPLLSRCDIQRKDESPEVLFKEDLNQLKNWLRRKGFVTDNLLTFEIYLKIVKKFLELYHCQGNFSEYKRRGIEDTEKGLQRTTCVWYTKEQGALLKNDRFNNVWISGAAGTGKTFVLKNRLQFLVLEIFKEMTESGDHLLTKSVKPILVITYNRPINLDIKCVNPV